MFFFQSQSGRHLLSQPFIAHSIRLDLLESHHQIVVIYRYIAIFVIIISQSCIEQIAVIYR